MLSIFHISYAICHMKYEICSELPCLRPGRRRPAFLNFDVVYLDLAVERSVVHSEQFRGAALMAAGNFERAAYQLDFEARDLVIERDASGDVERGRRFRHVRHVTRLRLRADYLLAQA